MERENVETRWVPGDIYSPSEKFLGTVNRLVPKTPELGIVRAYEVTLQSGL